MRLRLTVHRGREGGVHLVGFIGLRGPLAEAGRWSALKAP